MRAFSTEFALSPHSCQLSVRVEKVRQAWERADVDQKQRVQNILFPTGLKYHPEKGILNSENDCLFNQLEDFASGKMLMARPERFELPAF